MCALLSGLYIGADHERGLFVCVEVLGLSQPNGVMSRAVSLPLDPIYTGLVTMVQVLYLLEICCCG